MTAYRRPHYLERALRAWGACRGPIDMTVYIDPSDRTSDVRGVCEAFDVDHVVRPERLGVLNAPFQASTFVLLAEEDVIVSDDVIEYATALARRHADDSDVLAVLAHTWRESGEPERYFPSQQFHPLIWGTWRDRWQDIIAPTWDHDYSTGPGGGVEAGWDWNFGRVCRERGMWFLEPEQSRAQHIGQHEGAHCTADYFPQTLTSSFTPVVPPVDEYVVSGSA
jgi:hypothetical protein